MTVQNQINVDLLWTGPSETNFIEILFKIQQSLSNKLHFNSTSMCLKFTGTLSLTLIYFDPSVDNMPSKVRDETAYPFTNFNSWVQEWINNFITHFITDVIIYPCWDCRIKTRHPFLIEVSTRRRGRWQRHFPEAIAHGTCRASTRVWGIKLQPRFGWAVSIWIITWHPLTLA